VILFLKPAKSCTSLLFLVHYKNMTALNFLSQKRLFDNSIFDF
jgi:hypothetical protein